MERVLCPVLIGRDAELSRLEDALLSANRGQGQVVLLAGDAGMGKTRLASELAERAARLGMTVVVGGCSEADLALPYLPFLEAVGNHLVASNLETVRERLGPVRRELAHLFPQLEPEGLPPDVESTQGRLRLFEAMLALLRIPAQETGLLLVIEDLHWADASTRELLDYLTRRLRSARILVLGTYRRDELNRRQFWIMGSSGWRRASPATVVELEPMSPERVAAMVSAIFDEATSDDTRDFLHARTEGNPFVLEEMLKAALDSGDIFHTESGWDHKALSEMGIPATVRDTILLRLDRLSQEQIGVLRAASALGADFSYQVLVALSGQEMQAVQAAVEACVQQQLLREEAGRYRFRHALTREAVYEDMIAPQRVSLHSQAADILAGLGARAGEVAFHLLSAQRGDEALPLCLQAAEEAEAAYAHRDAVSLYVRALPLVHDSRLKAEVTCRLGAAYQVVGEVAQACRYLETAIPELEREGDRLLGAHFRLALGQAFWAAAQADRAAAEYEWVRRELEPPGPSQDLALAYALLAHLRLFNQRLPEGLELARRAFEIAEAAGSVGTRIQAQVTIGAALCHAGRFNEGLATLDKIFEEAIQLGYIVFAANALHSSTMQRNAAGRIDEMLARLELFGKLPDDPINRVRHLYLSGAYHLAGGRPATALESCDRMIAIPDAGLEFFIAAGTTLRAEALYDLDQLSEGRSQLPAAAAIQARTEIARRAQVAANLAVGEQDLVAATGEAALIFEMTDWSPAFRARTGLVAVDAFVRAGDLDAARRAASIAMEEQPDELQHWVDLIAGTLALGLGDTVAALPALRQSAEAFRSRGDKRFEWVTRHALAKALLESGELESAIAEARLVHEDSTRSGALRAGRLAAELLSELGVSPPTSYPEPTDATPGGTAQGEIKQLQAGERLVTVLFADVRGYTALTRAQAPAEMADQIATFQRWAATEVGRHRGLVDKFAGDAVMATFNVSGRSIDHALHALQTGIALQDKAATIGLPVGVGIATGPAIVGALAEGANVSVVGDTTNLASRLQGQAEGGEIMLSAETYRRVRDWIAGSGYESTAARLKLRGFKKPEIAHRVHRRGALPAGRENGRAC
jgi:class 3 adenylate cyclase